GRWLFKAPEAGDPANAQVFAYLAATSDKPEVIGAALTALIRAQRQVKPGEAKVTQQDYEALVKYALTSTFPRLQGRALAAVEAILRKDPNNELGSIALATLPKLTTGAAQHDLLEALSVLPAQQKRAALDKFIPLLPQLEPFVAARVFAELTSTARSVPVPPALI